MATPKRLRLKRANKAKRRAIQTRTLGTNIHETRTYVCICKRTRFLTTYACRQRRPCPAYIHRISMCYTPTRRRYDTDTDTSLIPPHRFDEATEGRSVASNRQTKTEPKRRKRAASNRRVPAGDDRQRTNANAADSVNSGIWNPKTENGGRIYARRFFIFIFIRRWTVCGMAYGWRGAGEETNFIFAALRPDWSLERHYLLMRNHSNGWQPLPLRTG